MRKQQQPELEVEQWYDEDALAVAIGITRERVQLVRREKIAREDWKIDHGYVALTRTGAEAILEGLGIQFPVLKKNAAPDPWGRPSLEDVLARAEIGGHAAGREGCERFRAMGPMQDTKKLLACRISDGFGCTVIVPNNQNFLIGMEFAARLVSEQAAVYELVGAPPRWRGRW